MQGQPRVFLHRLSLCIVMALITIAAAGFLTTAGQVVDEQGSPVEGAEIMILPGSNNVGISDSQGQFKITWSPRSLQDQGMASYIVARHKDKNLCLAIPIAYDTETIKLVLKPGVSVSGIVVDVQGKAIAGVQLSIMLHTPQWGSTIDSRSQTDSDGLFRLNVLPVENGYQLMARVDGYGKKDIFFNTGDAVNDHLDLGRIELPIANMSVSGRVVDINRHPVPGIQVYGVGEVQPSCHSISDEQGYFVLDGVCAGLVRIFAEGWINDERVSCQILTDAGARDISALVTENGYSRSYYVRTKSHEEIIKSGNPYIAGRVVDEDGLAVEDVPVNVRCMQKKNEEGQETESYFNVTKFGDVTDKQGRFAIELEEKAVYSLLFSPNNHPAIIAYDVVTDTKDLKVTLPKGGTIMGQVVRFSRGKKVPVPDVKVELKQTSRTSYSHIGFDRDRKTTTDTEGRFRFDHIRTLMRTDRQEPVFGPRIWELSYGDTSQTIKFLPGETVKHLDLVIRPDLKEAASLVGKPLPDYTGIDLDLNQDRFRDKRLLICFFDYAQRPARHSIIELNGQLARLREQGIEVVAVQASKATEDALDQWMKKMKLSIPVSNVTGDIDEVRFIWNVQSLAWLILTNHEHIVTAEGFNIDELDGKIETLTERNSL